MNAKKTTVEIVELYRAECACGWTGQTHEWPRHAEADAKEHRKHCRAPRTETDDG